MRRTFGMLYVSDTPLPFHLMVFWFQTPNLGPFPGLFMGSRKTFEVAHKLGSRPAEIQEDEPCERRRGRPLSKLGVSVSGLNRRSGGDKQMHWPFSSKQITLYHKECLGFALHHQKATDWFCVIRKKKKEEWLQGKCATERAFRRCRRCSNV